jgi:hypothetical protein
MHPYLRFEFEVGKDCLKWAWQATKKHIGKELLGSIAATLAAAINGHDSMDAGLVGLATLGFLVLCTILVSAVLAPFRVWARGQDALQASEKALSAIQLATEKRPTQAALDGLAEILSDGIHSVLNKTVTTEEQVEELGSVNDEWQKRLFKHLDDCFPRADALHVQRLGTIRQVVFPGYPSESRFRILSHFSRREELIRDILRKAH